MELTPPNPSDSITVHPDYPFVRIGLAFDFQPSLYDTDPAEHVVAQSDWSVEIAGIVQGLSYSSRERAMADVDNLLFADWQSPELIPQLIQTAVERNNVALALHLAREHGRALGRSEAEFQFVTVMAEADRVLTNLRNRHVGHRYD